MAGIQAVLSEPKHTPISVIHCTWHSFKSYCISPFSQLWFLFKSCWLDGAHHLAVCFVSSHWILLRCLMRLFVVPHLSSISWVSRYNCHVRLHCFSLWPLQSRLAIFMFFYVHVPGLFSMAPRLTCTRQQLNQRLAAYNSMALSSWGFTYIHHRSSDLRVYNIGFYNQATQRQDIIIIL